MPATRDLFAGIGVTDFKRAGHAVHLRFVSDLDARLEELADRGIEWFGRSPP